MAGGFAVSAGISSGMKTVTTATPLLTFDLDGLVAGADVLGQDDADFAVEEQGVDRALAAAAGVIVLGLQLVLVRVDVVLDRVQVRRAPPGAPLATLMVYGPLIVFS